MVVDDNVGRLRVTNPKGFAARFESNEIWLDVFGLTPLLISLAERWIDVL
jgi:hypothetical protein